MRHPDLPTPSADHANADAFAATAASANVAAGSAAAGPSMMNSMPHESHATAAAAAAEYQDSYAMRQEYLAAENKLINDGK